MSKLPTIADYDDIHECGTKWISVKDRLPEKEGRYLVVVPYDPVWVVVSSFKGKNFIDNVTHWQLLPEPPSNKE